jgi:hypothetical protein
LVEIPNGFANDPVAVNGLFTVALDITTLEYLSLLA